MSYSVRVENKSGVVQVTSVSGTVPPVITVSGHAECGPGCYPCVYVNDGTLSASAQGLTCPDA